MLERIFTSLTLAMNERFEIALAASFAWGVLSILLSPCHLSSIPLIVGYMVRGDDSRVRKAFTLSLLFALGILASIALIGLVTASIGRMLGDVGVWGNLIVSGVFLAVGLYLLDVIRPDWGGFHRRLPDGKSRIGALSLGFIFGLALGPCTFAYMAPVLGVVFSLAPADMAGAVALIAAFGVGHCTVIAGAGTFVRVIQRYLNWTAGSAGAIWLRRGAGVLVLLGGAYFIYTAF